MWRYAGSSTHRCWGTSPPHTPCASDAHAPDALRRKTSPLRGVSRAAMGAYAVGVCRVVRAPQTSPPPSAGHGNCLTASVMAALALRILDFPQTPLADDFGHDADADLFG